MEKTCCMCKESKDVSCFKSNVRRKDGLQSQCIDCQREYRRQHYLKNKKKYIGKAKRQTQERVSWWREYKKSLSCKICNENHPACIDFHHANGDKEANVSALIRNGSKEAILKEIAKCEVLCSNCHRKKHWKE